MTALPALLLFHGAGDSGECWEPFVRRLRRHEGLSDLRVSTPDAPAHGGRVAAPGRSIAWTDQLGEGIAHAESLVRETGRRIVVGGHSMGSMTALGVAANRPDLVVGTFLEDPPLMAPFPPPGSPDEPPTPADVHEFGQWFAELRATPFEDVVASARADHPNWDEGEYAPWARSKQAVDPLAFRDPVIWVHGDTVRIVRQAPAPVVVAAGRPELGGLVIDEAAAELRARPGWSFHRLPTGHDVRRDAPEATVTLLADLIRTAPL